MKTKSILILLVIFTLVTITGCSAENKSSNSSYTKITGKEAKEMMDHNNNYVILDVRTKEEYDSGHIKDAILIPNTDIIEKAEEALPDKSVPILIYCRSGRRSALAASDLVDLGYTEVYDFGGIIDWDYDIVTD